ncbi:MFS transporter [Gemmobacter lutimaris]|uniref:MFS transporter n=1 Tax=Gemmobacter lutimaris TaxID=2306023 RepID=A0A398C1Q7_9RHOB|nr:MFS transporter [Gemmobacter lutimaris]RID93383.1 MFS transporter [Gemmobacter lutimaris]
MSATSLPNDSIARRNMWVLVAAQAVLGAQMPVIFTIGGLAGSQLAGNPCWATLPISLTVIGSMLWAQPLSAVMQRWGRRVGFVLGALAGAAGAAVAAYGLYIGSFAVFSAASLLTGGYMSAQGFYRFAAADAASEAFRPKAISGVMAGGLASAIFGPQLVKLTSQAMVVPFLGSYLTVIALNLAGLFLFGALKSTRPAVRGTWAAAGRTRRELLRDPAIIVAMVCATVSYALMNLVMTSSPLAVVGCGFETSDAANIVSAHVLAMYAPSFVTGHIIARLGVEKVIALGLLILAGSGAVAMSGMNLENFYIALILLGIGWNFGFIGATSMLAGHHTAAERGTMQGLNDFVVFGGVSMASFASGGLMNCSGGSVQAGWSAVNMAMLPFLVLAGGALIWFALRPKETR